MIVDRTIAGNPGCQRGSARAFTLIELVVVIAVLAVIGLITVRYVVGAAELYAALSADRQADAEAGLALKRMQREIRGLRTALAAEADALAFVSRSGATNEFRLSGGDLLLNSNILARNVSMFSLAYYNSTNYTNGLLSPLPLDSTNRSLVRRIELDMQVSRGPGRASLNANFFLKDGVRK